MGEPGVRRPRRRQALAIEDYALLGDTQTAALVARDGSIDWLCLPRFDSDACFAALLGDSGHGRWLVAPGTAVEGVRRRYRPGTLILETELTTAEGTVRLVDFMPPRGREPDLVRIVEGVAGRVAMTLELLVRFGYGATVPWIRACDGGWSLVAGADALVLRSPVACERDGSVVRAAFDAVPGERYAFVLAWGLSHEPLPGPIDPFAALAQTETWWRRWSEPCRRPGPYAEAVLSSLVTLKGLTYAPSGGIVAAPTTSLPEQLGGVRNWDYRFCWLRDAAFVLQALMLAGFEGEAGAWCNWLLRTIGGSPRQLQVLYGVDGERRLTELELPWLPGYQGARPVRIGNAATEQLQLDVYGEVFDAMHVARGLGVPTDAAAWDVQRSLLDFLSKHWDEPDEGIWEMRGPRRCFTHSRVMAWVALDRAVRGVEQYGLPGPLDEWRRLRQRIHDEVCAQAWDAERRTFTQAFGSRELDASLLLIPLVGFLPASDERVRGTLAAIERELCTDGFVRRYRTRESIDGLPPGEGTFLACSFWLVDNLAMVGRLDEARERFEQLLRVRNDVGLLAEEYDPRARRMTGNFPQAFSHVGLIRAAFHLAANASPSPGGFASDLSPKGEVDRPLPVGERIRTYGRPGRRRPEADQTREAAGEGEVLPSRPSPAAPEAEEIEQRPNPAGDATVLVLGLLAKGVGVEEEENRDAGRTDGDDGRGDE